MSAVRPSKPKQRFTLRMHHLGFEKQEAGEGWIRLENPEEEGPSAYVLVTHEDGTMPELPSDPLLVGFYGGVFDEKVMELQFRDLDEFVAHFGPWEEAK